MTDTRFDLILFDADDTLFDQLYARPIRPERVLMVGDSHSSRVAGGRAMGFVTCWFNRGQRAWPGQARPDHVIAARSHVLALAGLG